MGNAESKKEDRSDGNSDRVRVQRRSLPELNTNRTELYSVPIDSGCFEVPDTPTSDYSTEDMEHFTGEDPTSTSHESVPVDDVGRSVSVARQRPSPNVRAALQFHLVRQLYHKFISKNSSSTFDLISGYVDVQYYEQIKSIAESVGFQSMEFDSPFCRLYRGGPPSPPDHTDGSASSANNRFIAYERILNTFTDQMNLDVLRTLDIAIEEGLAFYIKVEVKTKKKNGTSSNVVFQHDLRSFILPADVMEKIFRKVAQELKLVVQNLEDNQIALVQFDLIGTIKEEKEEEEEEEGKEVVEPVSPETKPEKVIQPGELVWRRLQHWSTNVRKEKKFNIWAKGLPDFAKEKILEIASEIGFEAAEIQPNGNIHLEIKPPEGIHRRKLKHATDEMRNELIPIDAAVCQNVEEHLNDWLADFHQKGEAKGTLNCRFVLPADWLRQTSERLAAQYGLKVKMETGIVLIFYKADLDLSQINQEAENQSKGGGAGSVSSKKKNKNRKKKTSNPDVQEGGGVPLRPKSEECSTTNTSSIRDFDSNKNRVSVDPSRSVGELIGVTTTSSPLSLNLEMPISNTNTSTTTATTASMTGTGAGLRRNVGRNKYDYGWDSNWPTA
eukprot:g3105.t1